MTLGRIPKFIRIATEGDMSLEELEKDDKIKLSFTEERRRNHDYVVEYLEGDGSIVARRVEKDGKETESDN